jgi:heat shock protein HslJ
MVIARPDIECRSLQLGIDQAMSDPKVRAMARRRYKPEVPPVIDIGAGALPSGVPTPRRTDWHAPDAEAPAELEDTYWKLVRLGGAPTSDVPNGPKPHLILHTNRMGFSGSCGCSRLVGGYALDGSRLTFGQVAGVLEGSAQDLEQERVFLAALARVYEWRITGTHLELLDASGEPLLGFEARYLR